MAVIRLYIYAKSLFCRVPMDVIIPTPEEPEQFGPQENRFDYAMDGQKLQTLWLLHGVCHGGESWLYSSDIVNLASQYRLAVVMPSAEASFYQNLPFGRGYFTFMTEELPRAMQGIFPLSRKRENNFICGFSMGGYGAFNLALRRPDRYGKAAAMSAALDTYHPGEESFFPPKGYMEAVYGANGEYFDPQKHDMKCLLKAAVESGEDLPRLYQCCGTDDELITANRAFRDAARALSADLTYDEGPGEHRWTYWNASLPKILEWLAPARGYVD